MRVKSFPMSHIGLGPMSVAMLFAAAVSEAQAAATDDACLLLTRAQVSAAVNLPVAAGAYQGTFKKTCTWNIVEATANSPKSVTVVFEDVDVFQANKVAPVKAIEVTPVRRIGDDAYYISVRNNVGLIVKKGNAVFKVAVYGDAPIEKMRAMEKTLAQRIAAEL